MQKINWQYLIGVFLLSRSPRSWFFSRVWNSCTVQGVRVQVYFCLLATGGHEVIERFSNTTLTKCSPLTSPRISEVSKLCRQTQRILENLYLLTASGCNCSACVGERSLFPLFSTSRISTGVWKEGSGTHRGCPEGLQRCVVGVPLHGAVAETITCFQLCYSTALYKMAEVE